MTHEAFPKSLSLILPSYRSTRTATRPLLQTPPAQLEGYLKAQMPQPTPQQEANHEPRNVPEVEMPSSRRICDASTQQRFSIQCIPPR